MKKDKRFRKGFKNQDIINEHEIEKNKSDFIKSDKYINRNDDYFNKSDLDDVKQGVNSNNFSNFKEVGDIEDKKSIFRKVSTDYEYNREESSQKKDYSKRQVKKLKEIEDKKYFDAQEYEKGKEENQKYLENQRLDEQRKKEDISKKEELRKQETTQKTYYEHQQEDRRKKEYQIQKDEEIRLQEQNKKPVASTTFRSSVKESIEKTDDKLDGMRSIDKSFNEINKEDTSNFDERVVDLRDRKEKFQELKERSDISDFKRSAVLVGNKDYILNKDDRNSSRVQRKDSRKERYKKRKAKELRQSIETDRKQYEEEQRKTQEARQKQDIERKHKLLIDQDLDNDGVIDRYDADPRDSSVQRYYQLEDHNFHPQMSVETSENNVYKEFRVYQKDDEVNYKDKDIHTRKTKDRTNQKYPLLIDQDFDNHGAVDRYDADPKDSSEQKFHHGKESKTKEESTEESFKDFRPSFKKNQQRKRKEYDNKYYYDNRRDETQIPSYKIEIENGLISIGYAIDNKNQDQNLGVKAVSKTLIGIGQTSKVSKDLSQKLTTEKLSGVKDFSKDGVKSTAKYLAYSVDDLNKEDKNLAVESIVKPTKTTIEAKKKLNTFKKVTGNFRSSMKNYNINKYYQKQKNKQTILNLRNMSFKQVTKDIKTAIFGRLKKFFESIKNIKKSTILKFILPIIFLFVFLITIMQSCSNMFFAGTSIFSSTSYLATIDDVTDTETYYSELEAKLQYEIENIEEIYPGHDEYKVTKDTIGHDPHLLISYLTIKQEDFKFNEIKSIVEEIFKWQYQYAVSTREETRYKRSYDKDGKPIDIPYTVRILEATLHTNDLEEVLKALLTEEEREKFDLLMETKGNFMNLSSPTEVDWKQNIKKKFGFSINEKSGEIEEHDGIDIEINGKILALTTGKVVKASGREVTIKDLGLGESSWKIIYENLSSVNVKVGQEVKIGDEIGLSGEYFTIKIKDGKDKYLNPYFHLYSDSKYIPKGKSENVSNETFNDYWESQTENLSAEALANISKNGKNIIKEAYKWLGTPYEYGAKDPTKGTIDCSGFTRWAYKGAGKNIPHGSINQWNGSTKIPESSLQPGDLIFFNKTFAGRGNQVTHVGIYIGDGKMIHAGSPVNITNYRNNYFNSKIVGFGRY